MPISSRFAFLIDFYYQNNNHLKIITFLLFDYEINFKKQNIIKNTCKNLRNIKPLLQYFLKLVFKI